MFSLPSMVLWVWVSLLISRGPPCPMKSSYGTPGFSVRGSGLNGFSVKVRGSVTTGLMSVGPIYD